MLAMAAGSRASNVFFKFQTSLLPNVELFLTAFPSVPWVYVHRDPVEVLASNMRNFFTFHPNRTASLSSKRTGAQAPCLRSSLRPSEYQMSAYSGKVGVTAPPNVRNVPKLHARRVHASPADMCASFLGYVSACMAHVLRQEAQGAGHVQRVVDYKDLPHKWPLVMQRVFGISWSDAQMGQAMAQVKVYSKARGGRSRDRTYMWNRQNVTVAAVLKGRPRGETIPFLPDSEAKRSFAPPQLTEAAEKFMTPLYTELSQYAVQY